MTDPTDLFKKLVRDASGGARSAHRSETQPTSPKSESLATPPDIPEPKRRGRPATGKRSDPNWIGRTYYIRKETDLDVEDELLQLKRQGIELDKSELVDKLLNAWVKWRMDENSEIRLSEITPIRKDDKE
ncbi:hypothetical protein H6F98_00070 [Microcoleus sp. FACHB-SPT15]|uniref:hypothetical protein n=1 Tax=Microcoleus sp. FACHB-SPT15 TaxID=2692830 RepID=UPI00177EF795|nr:hypothetical protein [Microcoleus sp. FACHB-SPT15]MBD1803874.1 hypothetical protein [Microcoleus sp. FACHB-SPT15]